MALPSIRAGLETLRANPLRTLLSTLGVIMGAASLVAVLSLGDGAESFARQRIQQEGYNHVLVEPIAADTVDGQRIARASVVSLTAADAEALGPVIGGRATGGLLAQGSTLWTPASGGEARGLRVVGLSPIGGALPTIAPVAAGRFLTAAETRDGAEACVVSHGLAALLSAPPADPAGALGATLTLDGRALRIVGIQEAVIGERGFTVVAPLARAEGALRESTRRIVLEAAHVEQVGPLAEDVKRWAEARGGWRGAVRVSAPGQRRLEEISRGILLFKMLMGAFTAIALIVGGIGIMNVLLASVVERTREIGIRKAVGARRRDIVTQFLTESVAIAAAGCLLGLAIGLAGAFGMTAVMRAQTTMLIFAGFSWGTLVASAGAALIVGLVFGTYPALRASRLSPIDAITRE